MLQIGISTCCGLDGHSLQMHESPLLEISSIGRLLEMAPKKLLLSGRFFQYMKSQFSKIGKPGSD
jgi:hypothetical protein